MDKSDPATVYLGRRHIVPGAEDGLTGMCVGEVRTLVVPPHLGYGEHGRGKLKKGFSKTY